MSRESQPKLFLYSFLVPTLWVVTSMFFIILLPSRKLGLLGTGLFLYLVITLIAWRVVSKWQRDLTQSESTRIMIYSAFWMVGLQLIIVLTGVLYALSSGAEIRTIGLVDVGLSSVIYIFVIWLSVKILTPKFTSWYLRRAKLDQR